jgi:hypothetical protein
MYWRVKQRPIEIGARRSVRRKKILVVAGFSLTPPV